MFVLKSNSPEIFSMIILKMNILKSSIFIKTLCEATNLKERENDNKTELN